MNSTKSNRRSFFGLALPIVGIGFSTRFFMDTNTRMFYPFAVQLASGLGLSLSDFGWLLFLRSIVGISGPFFGIISDRYGRRNMMIAALIGRGVSAAWLVFSQQWWAAIPIILSGLGLTAFVPAQQAYFSEQAPSHKLGRVMGFIEFSWASVALFALPVIGRMITNYGWRVPLLGLCLLQFIGAILVWRYFPAAAERQKREYQAWSEVKHIFFKRNVLASFFIAILVFSAVSSFITLWGLWLAIDFGLDAAKIGLATTGIGIAELLGAGLVSLFIDRIDKRRGSSLTLLILFFSFAILPLVPNIFPVVIAILMVLSLLFEVAIISLIPLFSEQITSARGTVMALVFSGLGLGASAGPPLATIMWEQSGPWGISLISAVSLLIASYLTRKFLSNSRSHTLQSKPTVSD